MSFNLGNWVNDNLVSDAKKEKNEQKKKDNALRTEQQAKIMDMLNESYLGATKNNSKTLLVVGFVLTATTILVLFSLKSKKNAKR